MKQGEQAGFLNPSGTGSNGFANNFIFTTYSENKVCTINTTVQRWHKNAGKLRAW